MTDDIVKALRECLLGGIWRELLDPAADEIERLRAELAKERERANILDIAFCDIADEMGIEPDNESMLLWVDGIKSEHNRLRAERDEAREVVAEAVQWLRVSDLPCEMTIFRADALLEGGNNGKSRTETEAAASRTE